MPDEIYEIIALAARYWFLLLMVLIAWRSYRWFVRDRKQYKKRLRLLPDAGYIGELVVVQGDDVVRKGTCFSVSREGLLGYLRSNDVCVPAGGVANRHLWYSFDDADGLRVEPLRGRMIVADGQELIGRRMHTYLSHGSVLQVGDARMRLRMFSGFEYAGEISAQRAALADAGEDDLTVELEITAHGAPVRRMHEIAAWQKMLEEDEAAAEDTAAFYPAEDADTGAAFYPPEYDDIDTEFYPPATDDPDGEAFYPPVDDLDDEPAA